MRNASRMARYMMMRPRDDDRGRSYTTDMETSRRAKQGYDNYSERYRAPRNEHTEYNGESYNRRGGGMYNESVRDGTYGENMTKMRGGYRQGDTDEGYEGGEPNTMRMNTIGFGNRNDPPSATEYPTGNYSARIEQTMGGEMEPHKGQRMGGYAMSENEFTPELAKKWTRKMSNADKTTGEHWTMEQVQQLVAQRNLKKPTAEVYAILNAMYSDYCVVAKRHNVNNVDFYLDMAMAWLEDKDAVPNKAAVYYECVVQH